MKLVKDAGRIAWRSYSLWVNRAAFACMIAPEAIFWATGIDTNPRLWFLIGAALYVAVEIARYIKQETISGITRSPAMVALMAFLMAAGVPEQPKPAQGTTEAATLSVAVPLIAKWEGLRTTAYRDIVGVWTVCYGETKGVRPGDSYTKAECRAMLAREVAEYRDGLHEHFTPETKQHRLTPERDAAYVSLAYNVGIGGAGRSTATRRLNAGDIRGGCKAIGWWNKAGQRVVRGLVRRRADEVTLCLKGLAT
ncbi:lysozyme [Roseovarius sp. MMSF_3281]|uniref:lysozyme n=1 Tax=Roseovarius sp. MMSF_3281 TaxID=3046694 RepID=UPI00273EF847|nr:lysozyme [Roseovarius sp. MMSF_3281]